ncbi:CLUMA_CG008507, isoform A [Clunio marinus]|uniref:RecQ-mediated genome instability protein 1 n=1 Tax=Clunio marinus TaxID=568069 RepID=A0A1J1I402_9DIPT|nr:CLUMA_CG008507, isoform A [Clunio marinus]
MNEDLQFRVDYVKSKLLSTHVVKVKNDWIVECVKFFISQSRNIDNSQLYLQAYEQFLLADVKEASNPVIPMTVLRNKQPFTLNGTFLLQMQFLIDIAESPYEQHRRLHNIKLDDVEEIKESKTFAAKKKRVFKLELTDGHNTISAMEYTTIPVLNSKLSPGIKLQVIGPLQVVNHILLLESKNLKILGGDVDDLLISNAYENVLLKALNKPLTETPLTDYKVEPTTIETQRQYRDANQQHATVINQNNPNKQIAVDDLNGINFDDEDDFDEEMLLQIEEVEQRNRSSQESNNSNKQQKIDDEIGEDILEAMEVDDLMIRQRLQNNEIIEINDNEHLPRINQNDLLIPNIDIPEDNESQHVDFISRPSNSNWRNSIENSDDQVPKKIARVEPTRCSTFSDNDYKFKTTDGFNIVTIDQYISMKTTEKAKKAYVIKARVHEFGIRKKLRIDKKKWHLECDLTDSYSEKILTAKFSNNILEFLSGATGQEMQAMYLEAKARPQLREDINRIIERLRIKIIELHNFLKIDLNCTQTTSSKFEVIEILDDNNFNSQILSKKLKEENLKEVN